MNKPPDIDRNAAVNLVGSHYEAGRSDEAETLVRKYLLSWPDDLSLLNFSALLCKRRGDFEGAVTEYKRALQIHPNSSVLLGNLGNTHLAMGNPAPASDVLARAVDLDPKQAGVRRTLGIAQRELGDLSAALNSFRAANALNPRDVKCVLDLASILSRISHHDEALAVVERHLALAGEVAQIAEAKAILLRLAGRREQCRDHLQSILRRDPAPAWAYYQMGHLIGPGLQKANEYLQAAHQQEPQNLEYLRDFMEAMNRARYGQESTNIQEAYELAQKLMSQAKPLLPHASALYPVLLHCGNLTALDQIGTLEELGAYWGSKAQPSALAYLFGRVQTLQQRRLLLDYHRMWGKQVEADAARRPIERPARSRRREKIRIGIMSSDLRNHPVSYFVAPLLENYDRTRFEFYCYSYFDGTADSVQQHISKTVDVFRLNPGITARDAARVIADDDLDILFEIGGKTAKNKPEALAWKPASVCASWLGYQHSCGLSAIDYVVVDPFINPSQPGLLIEKPLIMDHSWVVMGSWVFDDRRPINPVIPEERKGWLTFGTMNNPYKFSTAALAAWAEILSQVDRSRFLFVRPEADTHAFKEHMWRAFEAGGISRERVEFVGVRGAHMPHYNDIDIALDTFPQTGSTTTCESLWMGVPVISLVGDALFERASYSNLSNAGLGDLCAFDHAGYVRKAIALANDRARRTHLRQSLRSDIRARPLGRVQDFVTDFQRAVERVTH